MQKAFSISSVSFRDRSKRMRFGICWERSQSKSFSTSLKRLQRESRSRCLRRADACWIVAGIPGLYCRGWRAFCATWC